MAKKKATSLVPDEQNMLSRNGSELPRELPRQDRAAPLPDGLSYQTPPKPIRLSKTVTEEYFDKNGKANSRGSSTRFTPEKR